MEFCLIYVTCQDKAQAESIGSHLVEEKLVACVNIIEAMQSMYWWEGKVEKAKETILIAKTKSALFKRASEKIRALHSYDCPCIVQLPISDGHSPYLNWISSNVIE